MGTTNRRDWIRQAAVGSVMAGLGPGAAQAQSAQRPRAAGYRYVHLDVFTDTKLAGNQLLVYVDPEGLEPDAMARLTVESNFSENTFVFPAEQPGTDFRVRIFTRGGEVPFAGHPTIGTAFALAHVGRLRPGTAKSTFGLGVGPTPIDLQWKVNVLAFAWMTQLKPTFGKSVADATAVASAIGLQPSDIAASSSPAAQEVSTGSNFIVVPLASRRAVDAAVLDRAKMDALRTADGLSGRGVYVVTTERGADDGTSYSRLLGGSAGIEDPATGSAAGPAGCFMVKYGLIPPDRTHSMINVQGVLVKRPSKIYIDITSTNGEIGVVKVGGTSVLVGEGTVSI